MESSKRKSNVALSSVFASLLMTLMKGIVGLLTGSMGILSEAAHSLLDLGAAGLTFFAVRIGDKPADESHPYGHAKVESVSALIETGLLFLTCAWIIYEAVKRLISHEVVVQATWYAFAIIIISILIDISRSRALSKVAKETHSQALEADALHFSSDIWSSIVVLVGLIFVKFGIVWADAVAALGVSLFVCIAGYRLGKRTIDVLIDSAPKGITEVVKEAAAKVAGVASLSRVRVRPVGPTVFVELTAAVSRKYSVAKVQEIVKAIEKAVRRKIKEADVVVTTVPMQLDDETIVETIQIIAAKQNLFLHDIVVETLGQKKFVSYDLEVLNTFSVDGAHDVATHLEEVIADDLGEDVELTTHIEPIHPDSVKSAALGAAEEKKIMAAVAAVAKKVPLLRDVHDIRVRKIHSSLFITLHCYVRKKTSLETAHTATSRLEYLVKQKVHDVMRVVVHLEPKGK